MGVDLEEFAVAFAIVQDLVIAQCHHRRCIEIVFGFDILIIVVGNFEEIRAARAYVRDGRENIGARKCDVLDPGAEKFADEAGRQRARGR